MVATPKVLEQLRLIRADQSSAMAQIQLGSGRLGDRIERRFMCAAIKTLHQHALLVTLREYSNATTVHQLREPRVGRFSN